MNYHLPRTEWAGPGWNQGCAPTLAPRPVMLARAGAVGPAYASACVHACLFVRASMRGVTHGTHTSWVMGGGVHTVVYAHAYVRGVCMCVDVFQQRLVCLNQWVCVPARRENELACVRELCLVRNPVPQTRPAQHRALPLTLLRRQHHRLPLLLWHAPWP